MGSEFSINRTYKQAEIYSAGGDVSKHWYVWYLFRGPDGTMKMFKKTLGMNRIHNAKKRMTAARAIQNTINRMLSEGFSPYGKSKDNLPLSDGITKYSDEHLSKIRSRSRTTYKSSVNHLLRYFQKHKRKDISLQDVTKQDIISALNYWMKEKKWQNRQWNNSLARWRHFFNWLASQNSLQANPTDKIPFLKNYPTDVNRPPTEDEFSIIVNHLYQHDKRLFLYMGFIYFQGYRTTETGLLQRWRIEFNTDHPYIRLPASDQKDNEQSIQYLSPHFLPYLYEMGIDKLPGDYFLFTKNLEPSPKPQKKIKEDVEIRWKEVVKQGLKIPVNIYSVKSKQATELGERVSDEKIKDFLRHSDVRTTKMYMKGKRAQVPIEFFQHQNPLPLKESQPVKIVKMK